MKKTNLFVLLLFILVPMIYSCSLLINQLETSDYKTLPGNGKKIHIVFGHNVNGETNPCGCRQFPLGGLPQVAGALAEIKKNGEPVIYIDTGDMLFPSNNVPETLKSSLTFTAEYLFHSLESLGLNYMVAGDQDLGLGTDYLARLINKSKVQLLISNLKPGSGLKVKKWARIENGNVRIYLIGVGNPGSYTAAISPLLSDAHLAIKQAVEEIKADGYIADNPNHRLILLSHGGMDFDIENAKAFPQLNWIIGAHTQSFTRIPYEQGTTQMVQVLSRNHYLGHIILDVEKGKSADQYQLVEMRQEVAGKLTPNPYFGSLAEHKKQLEKVQAEEQEKMTVQVTNLPKFSSANSCLDCHEAQGKHWQATPHSLAFLTMLKARSENNGQCVGCHTLGFQKERGFSSTKDVVVFALSHSHDGEEDHSHEEYTSANTDDPESLKQFKKIRQDYWSAVSKNLPISKSVREMPAKELLKARKKWDQLNDKFTIQNDFANVQCLNCHNQPYDHPFTINHTVDKKLRQEEIAKKCQTCHVPDQAPHWYVRDEKGNLGELDKVKFAQAYKKMSCPRYVEQ